MRSSSKRDKADVARRELIGLETEIQSPHAGWNGLVGRVVDETKHTLVVELASGREIRLPKIGQRFVFRVEGERFVVDGANIAFRPEDRTKKSR